MAPFNRYRLTRYAIGVTQHSQLPQRVPVRPRPSRKPPVWLLGLLAGLLAVAVAGVFVGLLGDDTPTPAPAAAVELDDAARLACNDFAAGYPLADSTAERAELARKVNGWARSSRTERITDLGADLARVADGSTGAWRLAADGFAARCVEAGWKAR